MKYSFKPLRAQIFVMLLMFPSIEAWSQEPAIEFGEAIIVKGISHADQKKNILLRWIDVNTSENTWSKKRRVLKCFGEPIGVMRSERQYENFLLHIEWKHTEPGGNSGVFVWSDAIPDEKSRLPNGVEVQMLELDWVKLNTRDGVIPPDAYVHGELFGVGGVTTTPDNPRGTRSKSVENRCMGRGNWNVYDVVCVDGVIKLSVNGKFVNGISKSSKKKGYICLESEGAEIHFRNIKIIELPAGVDPDGF